jgi:hypothetical protein
MWLHSYVFAQLCPGVNHRRFVYARPVLGCAGEQFCGAGKRQARLARKQDRFGQIFSMAQIANNNGRCRRSERVTNPVLLLNEHKVAVSGGVDTRDARNFDLPVSYDFATRKARNVHQ